MAQQTKTRRRYGAVDAAGRHFHRRILGTVLVRRPVHDNKSLRLRTHVILAVVVPHPAVLRNADVPFLLAEIIDERATRRNGRVGIRSVCIGVDVCRDVAVAVGLASVRVQIAVGIRTETRQRDDHHDQSDADHDKSRESAEYPPDCVRLFTRRLSRRRGPLLWLRLLLWLQRRRRRWWRRSRRWRSRRPIDFRGRRFRSISRRWIPK